VPRRLIFNWHVSSLRGVALATPLAARLPLHLVPVPAPLAELEQ
jgi:hypothetical protein